MNVQSGKRRARVLEVGERVIVCAAVFVASVYWSICSFLIHNSFHSNGWDLGLINQVIWNSAHGRFFEYSFRNISFAGDHWEPSLLILVPLKWVTSGPEALLIVQAIILALGAIPLYAAGKALGCRYAVALVGAYLLGLGAARAISFDFHIETFAPLLAFSALWGLATDRRLVFVVAAILILALKEDSALLVLLLCWVAWFTFERRRLAGFVAAAAVTYGFVVSTFLIPHFRGMDLNPFAERYGYLGDSPAQALWSAAIHPDLVIRQLGRPEAFEGVALVLASAAFLPLLAPRMLPPLVALTLLPLLSKETAQGSLDLHYLLIPSTAALLIAVVVSLGGRRREQLVSGSRWRRRDFGHALSAALIGIATLIWTWKSPLPPSFAVELGRFDVDAHAAVADRFVQGIPDDAVVSAQSPFVSHLSERRHIYQFPRVLDAELILLDEYGPIPIDDLAAGYADCLAALPRLGFDEVSRDDGITLWRRARPAEFVPDAPSACSGQDP